MNDAERRELYIYVRNKQIKVKEALEDSLAPGCDRVGLTNRHISNIVDEVYGASTISMPGKNTLAIKIPAISNSKNPMEAAREFAEQEIVEPVKQAGYKMTNDYRWSTPERELPVFQPNGTLSHRREPWPATIDISREGMQTDKGNRSRFYYSNF